MNKKNNLPAWKIKGLKKAQKFLTFESFDIFPSNRKAGFYCSALLRQGLIQAVNVNAWGNNVYEMTVKGHEFINERN